MSAIPEIEVKIDKLVEMLERAPDTFSFYLPPKGIHVMIMKKKTDIRSRINMCRIAYNRTHGIGDRYLRGELEWMNELYRKLKEVT